MTGALSMYGRDMSLAIFFMPDQVEPPDTLWLALCTGLPTPGDNGNDLIEPDDDAYNRVSYPTGADYWAPTGRGGVANTQEVFFPEPTMDWGLILGWALCSDSAGGQTFYVGDLLVAERIIFDPDNPRVWGLGAGGLVVRQT
jgi:hypothetical protein